FARSENVNAGGFRELAQLVSRQWRKNIDGRQTVGNLILGANWQDRSPAFDLDGSRGKGEAQSVPPERVPDSLPHERISVVVPGVVFEPVFIFPVNRRLAEISNPDDWSDLGRNIIGVTHRFAHHVDRFRRRVGKKRAEKDETSVEV